MDVHSKRIETYDINQLELAILTTKLSNERIYLTYLKTGLAILAIAVPFKKYYIALIGAVLILCSTLEYYYINHKLNKRKKFDFDFGMFQLVPIVTTILIIGIFYFEMKTVRK